jgi:2-amino-4-hydroxy-6-hydroxymethyldihydropteridine diphosphokinase
VNGKPASPRPGRGEQSAYLALGSNLGDRLGFLQGAVAGLAEAPGIEVTAASRVYETAPVGGPEQGPYLNAVVALRTRLSPAELLGLAHLLEDRAGRVRAERWGARTLDVDVLLVGDERVDTRDLTVPHPRLWQRGFVLAPLADVAPHLVRAPDGGWPGVQPVDAVLRVGGSATSAPVGGAEEGP